MSDKPHLTIEFADVHSTASTFDCHALDLWQIRIVIDLLSEIYRGELQKEALQKGQIIRPGQMGGAL